MTQALEDVKDIGSLQVLQSVESDKIRIELRERFWLLIVISNMYDYFFTLILRHSSWRCRLLANCHGSHIVLTPSSLDAIHVTCLHVLSNFWCSDVR